MTGNAADAPKWSTAQQGVHCALTVTHTCGHTAKYAYCAEEYALNDVPRLLASKCVLCAVGDFMVKLGEKVTA